MVRCFAFVAVVFAGSPALAETASNYLNLDLRQNRYLGDVTYSEQMSNFTFLSGDLNLETESPGFHYKLNPVAQGAFEASREFYFGVPEAYVQPRKIAPWFNLTIGRQKRTWSRLDEQFNLGIWQPQLRWDYLAPRQQGLTGVFFDWSLSSTTRFTFFTSPLHIPDQGPQYQLSDGKFSSENRWFVPPQSRVQLFKDTPFASDAPLYFELNRPSEEDLVMHSSFGMAFHYQSTSPFWAQFSYAYKPLNQIHLGIECANCANIGGGGPLEVTARIHPKIVKHHVVTWETGFDRVDDRGWLSLTGDFPNASGMPESYEEAPLRSQAILGAAYQHFLRSILRRPSWLQYSYMRNFDLEREENDSLLSEDQVTSSLDRYLFREVAAIEWGVQLSQLRRNRLNWRTRYTYSVPERGGWISSSLDFSQEALTWSVGADVLGADVDPASADAGLFSRYRANDRVFGGVSYVF